MNMKHCCRGLPLLVLVLQMMLYHQPSYAFVIHIAGTPRSRQALTSGAGAGVPHGRTRRRSSSSSSSRRSSTLGGCSSAIITTITSSRSSTCLSSTRPTIGCHQQHMNRKKPTRWLGMTGESSTSPPLRPAAPDPSPRRGIPATITRLQKFEAGVQKW